MAAVGCREATPPTGPTAGGPDLATAAAAPSFYQFAAGGFHSCAVATDGSAWCWGDGGSGQLGDGFQNYSLVPVRVAGNLAFRQITTDAFSTCGVTTDFHAYCWGDNRAGQLGDGTTTERHTPTPVAGGHRFYQVNLGTAYACGVSYPDRQGYCWGENRVGQLGDASLTERHRPVRIALDVSLRQVTAGAGVTCAVTTADQAYCWGSNEFGQLGDGSSAQQRKRPGQVAGGLRFSMVEAGTSHVCGVTTARAAYCWGYGKLGQIGDGKTVIRRKPALVAGGLQVTRVAPGSGFTCAETANNSVYCWGSNEYGQIGDGTTTRRRTPVPVAGGLRFAQVGAGGWNACGKTPEGDGYCWGLNDGGQLGDGTLENRREPTPIADLGSLAARAATGRPAARVRGDSLAHPTD
jgi:alpha-tubulin suppressor-like RCC1 family protein